MASNNKLITKLLSAEKEADAIIQTAKENRSRKLKEAHAAADEEIKAFRKKEAKRLQKEFDEQHGHNDDAHEKMEATSKKEIDEIKDCYKANKEKVCKTLLNYVVSAPDYSSVSDEARRQIRIRFNVDV
eukprot:GHVH01012132.1.p1 GENE.GHVH01012132.1~~GHVH01012132.1.p1  ORF type:complete len:129 (+),score=27.57 GHVH01012132.1:106-492(+)